MTEENRKIVEKKAGIIVTAAHALGSIQRSLAPPATGGHAYAYFTCYRRYCGHGVADVQPGHESCCECAAMAADAGLVRADEEIVCIGGTGRGADTALVIKPDYSHRFFGMRVKEVICKPRL